MAILNIMENPEEEEPTSPIQQIPSAPAPKPTPSATKPRIATFSDFQSGQNEEDSDEEEGDPQTYFAGGEKS